MAGVVAAVVTNSGRSYVGKVVEGTVVGEGAMAEDCGMARLL